MALTMHILICECGKDNVAMSNTIMAMILRGYTMLFTATKRGENKHVIKGSNNDNVDMGALAKLGKEGRRTMSGCQSIIGFCVEPYACLGRRDNMIGAFLLQAAEVGGKYDDVWAIDLLLSAKESLPMCTACCPRCRPQLYCYFN